MIFMTKHRVGWIDIAKGICMIAVIIGHMMIEELEFVYSFHLTTFFILTGYTLHKEKLNSEYLRKKFKRLMVPYFITCLVITFGKIINLFVLNNDYTIQSFTYILRSFVVKTFFASGGVLDFGSISLGWGIGAIWFLPAMFFALIFIQLVLRLKSKGLQGVVAIIMFALSAIMAKVIWLPFSILASMFAVPFILFGKFLRDGKILEKIKWWHYLIFLGIFVFGCFCFFDKVSGFYMYNCDAEDWLLTPLFAICSSLCVIGLSRLIKKCPPLEYVGKHSLIFLCVHLVQMEIFLKHFTNAREALHLTQEFWPPFIMNMFFIITTSIVVVWLVSCKKQLLISKTDATPIKSTIRDRAIDIMRAILIILMIVGHESINRGFRTIIYSFHMMAFIMVSGYFYNDKAKLSVNLKKAFKTLLPYLAFCILFIIFQQGSFTNKLITIACGVNYTNKIPINVENIGAIYFVLMLFIVKLIYAFVGRIRNEILKNAVVLSLFLTGIWLGKNGIWLPWAFDCALVSLMFYHIAHYLKKYDILKKCIKLPVIYFPLICVWMFMVYSGGMEIACRTYCDIGLMILGVVSMFIILYMSCTYLANCLPSWLSVFMRIIGQSTASILVIHAIFGVKISSFIVHKVGFNHANIAYLLAGIGIQLVAGIITFLIIKLIKKGVAKVLTKKKQLLNN